MKKGIKGEMINRVMIMMMVVVMVMGCNSGGVAGGEQGKNKFLQSLVNVSNEFLNVFTSFGEMVGSVLGLSVESKKSDVGKYFKSIQETIEGVKIGLNKIVAEMKEEKNPNAEGVESAVKKLVSETLDKIIEGAKTASEAIDVKGDELLGNVGAVGAAAGSEGEVENLIKGIRSIIGVALKKGKHDAGDANKAEDGSTARTAAGNGEAGKLFNAANAGDAANSKDGTIAGAIALRAMAKGGKFAGPSEAAAEYNTGVKNTVVSAVISTFSIKFNRLLHSF
ncbi:variable large family protein [Borrelia duttonii]|uniref:variable large family protein n=1 Tax=Borrelia duttonii TaxID=40834 RepID=UPI00384C8D9F